MLPPTARAREGESERTTRWTLWTPALIQMPPGERGRLDYLRGTRPRLGQTPQRLGLFSNRGPTPAPGLCSGPTPS
ncbi:hypothetical protein JZ751_005396 [Albula glossodonta]|uniref:Uncharacterized protein n=1 Tax=Albula glossodonta TaxID=121402 RepID=A0A8T2NC64_9TELE|nr:hypothetical protein JZ751_005396 [Albula glossodonta]